jgi:hypothetical protein
VIVARNEYRPQEERDETDALIELPVTGHETYFVQFISEKQTEERLTYDFSKTVTVRRLAWRKNLRWHWRRSAPGHTGDYSQQDRKDPPA